MQIKEWVDDKGEHFVVGDYHYRVWDGTIHYEEITHFGKHLDVKDVLARLAKMEEDFPLDKL